MTSISYKSIETEISSKDCINLNGKKKLNQRININNKKFCQNEESKQNSSLESETNGNELSLNYRPKLFLRCHCKDNGSTDNHICYINPLFCSLINPFFCPLINPLFGSSN
jgi:hypothetical protein